MVNELKESIQTRIATLLGSGYTKLSYVTNISLNKFKANSSRYGVLPKGATETSGQTSTYTMDHTFSVFIVDGYNDGAANQLNDDVKATKVATLMDKAHQIYRDIAANKALLSATPNVLVVNNLSIYEVTYIEVEKVMILQFDFNIKYKQ